MTGHKVYARHSGVERSARLDIPLLKRCVLAALRSEGVDIPCEVSVLITDDSGIRKLNRGFRGIDKPTDVLSFPMTEASLPGWAAIGDKAADPETGLFPLGEIVFSAERVRAQASEYKHSVEREMAYLTAHSVLHLLGYDHVGEAGMKKQMRDREEQIIREIGI